SMADSADSNQRVALLPSARAFLEREGYLVDSASRIADEPLSRRSDEIIENLTMLSQADLLVLLPGWQMSRGAATELAMARWLGIPHCEMHRWNGEFTLTRRATSR
ncbi:MAG: DUF4406 domain-containing protein, partial [Rhodococcus sp.]|nr:DUF4406 domain-containing protein [Rhodococcus sp. (in: high G+C Gram-positive bacteria)]